MRETERDGRDIGKIIETENEKRRHVNYIICRYIYLIQYR